MSELQRVSGARLALLSLLFFCICLGLGYPSLNRVDWRTAPGLTDVRSYVRMVEGLPPSEWDDHRLFRVLVPCLARPVYHVAEGHIGTWDPAMLGLLVVDSLLVAGTAALLLAVVMQVVGSYPVALVSALIYMLNFAVPNLRLAGFIDAGESFFLMAAVWALLKRQYWTLPMIGVLGAMAKELFVPFLIALGAAWWLCERRSIKRPGRAAAWIVISWAMALGTLSAVQWRVAHVAQSALAFGLELHGNGHYFSHLMQFFVDRNLWYTFFWLAPLGLVRVRDLPRTWRMGTAAAAVAAMALDLYYSGLPGTIARTMFSVAGPLLSASVALLLFGAGAESKMQDIKAEG